MTLQPSPARLQASCHQGGDLKWVRPHHMNNPCPHNGALWKELHLIKTFPKPPVGLSWWGIKLEQVKSNTPKTH